MTETAITKLYETIAKIHDPSEVKKSVADAVYISISRLEDQGKGVTSENISELLNAFADDFIEASKTDVA